MENSINTRYSEFVLEVMSEPSKDSEKFHNRIGDLESQGCNVSMLLTAALGLSAEAGEFTEIVKKLLFQGKPYSEENIFHMKRELSDTVWYLTAACLALNISLDDVIKMNVEKLEARYPGGKFNIVNSEIRKEGDV